MENAWTVGNNDGSASGERIGGGTGWCGDDQTVGFVDAHEVAFQIYFSRLGWVAIIVVTGELRRPKLCNRRSHQIGAPKRLSEVAHHRLIS